jgi:hypothetical protein
MDRSVRLGLPPNSADAECPARHGDGARLLRPIVRPGGHYRGVSVTGMPNQQLWVGLLTLSLVQSNLRPLPTSNQEHGYATDRNGCEAWYGERG